VPTSEVDLAEEIVSLARTIRGAGHLRELMGGRGVTTSESLHESNRSIEILLLEDLGESIQFAIFSEGESGAIGLDGIATDGAVTLGRVRVFIDGVPVREIGIRRANAGQAPGWVG
jgi:hypothetical protein